jgi:SAM-dependent methyltransferase
VSGSPPPPAPPATTPGTAAPPAPVVIADGPRWRAHLPAASWQLTIWVRSSAPNHSGSAYQGDNAENADIVVDLHDPGSPVIRHIDWWFAPADAWYRTETQAFFAARAATWDIKFGDDLPAYTTAVAEADLPPGGVVVDVGCGTGRALPALRDAVGAAGTVIGVDLTPQMLAQAQAQAQAHARGRGRHAALILADARQLSLADASADAVFAAGLIMHLPDTDAGLRELARITRPGGRLVLSTPPAGPPSPPATAAPSAPTSPSPKPNFAGPPNAPAGS